MLWLPFSLYKMPQGTISFLYNANLRQVTSEDFSKLVGTYILFKTILFLFLLKLLALLFSFAAIQISGP